MTEDLCKIGSEYRRMILEWVAAASAPINANRLFRKHHAFYKEIRDTAAGQAALCNLLTDSSPAVRLMAATHLLPIDESLAVPVLTQLAKSQGAYSLVAKYTLISFAEGSLNLNW